jgi:hypothetical protein
MTGTGTYMYAITRPIAGTELGEVSGVLGSPVRVVSDGALACVVSTVDLVDFGEQALRANLEDLTWVERVSRAHDDVVRGVAAMGTTAPLRLATVCSDDTSVQQRLRRLGARGEKLLTSLEGRDEWGMKVLGGTAPPAAAAVTSSSGAAYLRQRRADLANRDEVAAVAARQADELYTFVAANADAARRHRPQDARLSGLARPMLLNAAFLVARDDLPAFRRAVDAVAQALPPDSVQLTGPWPPYSFAVMDDA